MILGCLHMPLRPTIDWYRWICLICSSRKVGLTPHGLYLSLAIFVSANLRAKPWRVESRFTGFHLFRIYKPSMCMNASCFCDSDCV